MNLVVYFCLHVTLKIFPKNISKGSESYLSGISFVLRLRSVIFSHFVTTLPRHILLRGRVGNSRPKVHLFVATLQGRHRRVPTGLGLSMYPEKNERSSGK